MNSIQTVYALAKQAGNHNEEGKKMFERAGRKLLRKLAKDLNLKKEDFDIRFNPGGPAVSGEVTLHHEAFYVQFGEFGGYWRTCKSRKDYTGGDNKWILPGNYLRKELNFAQLKNEILAKLTVRGF